MDEWDHVRLFNWVTGQLSCDSSDAEEILTMINVLKSYAIDGGVLLLLSAQDLHDLGIPGRLAQMLADAVERLVQNTGIKASIDAAKEDLAWQLAHRCEDSGVDRDADYIPAFFTPPSAANTYVNTIFKSGNPYGTY